MSNLIKQVLSNGEIFDQLQEVICLNEAFETFPSVKAIVDECSVAFQHQGYIFDVEALEGVIESELLWQAQVRHEAPWFSEGIRAELKKMGCPVTIQESLDDAFRGHEGEIRELICHEGLDKAPFELERLWGPDYGYFYVAYDDPVMIFDSWVRLGIVDLQGNLIQ